MFYVFRLQGQIFFSIKLKKYRVCLKFRYLFQETAGIEALRKLKKSRLETGWTMILP
jgi:hypothetical protein